MDTEFNKDTHVSLTRRALEMARRPGLPEFKTVVGDLRNAAFSNVEDRSPYRTVLQVISAADAEDSQRIALLSELFSDSLDERKREDILTRILASNSDDSVSVVQRLSRRFGTSVSKPLLEIAKGAPRQLEISVGETHRQYERIHERLQKLRIPVEPFGNRFEADRLKRLEHDIHGYAAGNDDSEVSAVNNLVGLILHGEQSSHRAIARMLGSQSRLLKDQASRSQLIATTHDALSALQEHSTIPSDAAIYSNAIAKFSSLFAPSQTIPKNEVATEPKLQTQNASATLDTGVNRLLSSDRLVVEDRETIRQVLVSESEQKFRHIKDLIDRFQSDSSSLTTLLSALRERPTEDTIKLIAYAASCGSRDAVKSLISIAVDSSVPAPTLQNRRAALDAFWRNGDFEPLFSGPSELWNLFEKEAPAHQRGVFLDRSQVAKFVTDHLLDWPNRSQAFDGLMTLRWYRLLSARNSPAVLSPISIRTGKVAIAFHRARGTERGHSEFSSVEKPFGDLIARMSPEEIEKLGPVSDPGKFSVMFEILRLHHPGELRANAILKLLREQMSANRDYAQTAAVVSRNADVVTRRTVSTVLKENCFWSELALFGYAVGVAEQVHGSGTLGQEALEAIPVESIPECISTLHAAGRKIEDSANRFIQATITFLRSRANAGEQK